MTGTPNPIEQRTAAYRGASGTCEQPRRPESGGETALQDRPDGRLRLRWFTPDPGSGAGTVVATGVFDLLHVGHLRFLRMARAAGARLIVGVEDDERTRARKGLARPIVTVDERCEMVAALEPVDAVFVISGSPDLDPAPAYRDLLARIGPAMIAFTEGDPARAGRIRVAAALGAEAVEVPRVDGRSTTVLVEQFTVR